MKIILTKSSDIIAWLLYFYFMSSASNFFSPAFYLNCLIWEKQQGSSFTYDGIMSQYTHPKLKVKEESAKKTKHSEN